MKFGPIIHLQLGEIPTVVISSARLAKEALKNHDLAISSRPNLYPAKYLFYNSTGIAFSPYGDYWRYIRKICILELLSSKRVQSYAFVREQEVARLVQQIAESCSGVINLSKLLALYSNDVLCQVVFGRDFSEGGSMIVRDFRRCLKNFNNYLEGSVLVISSHQWNFCTLSGRKSRLVHTFQRFDQFFSEVIKDHRSSRKGKDHKDFVDVLLEVQKNQDADMPLIKALLLDMFAAGTDTTFITLDWVITELVMNPKVLKKTQAEVRSIVGDRKSVTENDLPQLQYMKAIIKEIFRLHPPAPLLVPRESMEDITIGGYTIPVGAGRRICPAIGFGTATVELALAHLLHCFDWKLPPGVRGEDLNMMEVFGITMHRIEPLILAANPNHTFLKLEY